MIPFHPSFRFKLFLATTLVVAFVTGATLLVTEHAVERDYRQIHRTRFESEVERIAALRDARLASVRDRCLDLAGSVRLLAAIEERDADLLYRIALDELRAVLTPPGGEGAAATFFRFVDARGRVVPPTDRRAGLVAGGGVARWEEQIAEVARTLGAAARQQVGYLAPRVDGTPRLQEVVATGIVDPVTRRSLGGLAIGFPAEEGPSGTAIRSGIWLDGRLFSKALPPALGASFERELSSAPPEGVRLERTLDSAGQPVRLFALPLDARSGFPRAYQVGVYPLGEELAAERRLGLQILGFAALALTLGLSASYLIARSLTVPIRELVAGTAEIRRGNLGVRVPVRARDEVGRLATSFNEMAEGLALKERYRSVLDLVADPEIARELVEGQAALGGEVRDVTVLFCDIRGFTSLTEGMDPARVIELLNEHMTALTRVIHDRGGAVDKFVGDSLMALFGAPRSHGDDARRAVGAALGLVAERDRLNARSPRTLSIGVGIATGSVVVGCMGSADRLNYTAVGERVNLSARLCAAAAPGEILVDEATFLLAGDLADAQAIAELPLKGFRGPVRAYRLTARPAIASAS
ncbi:MAG: adenylate cyclase [Candidatus Binatota bacterium]|nr:adenylate cyclase [Candidatus Binatota bacterium]